MDIKSVPHEKKNEMILELTLKVEEQQRMLKMWTNWATEKIMEATQKLSKHKAELQTLRQEKEEDEQLKTKKQFVEETTKGLSELEKHLYEANEAVERLRRLEDENSELKVEMVAVMLHDMETAAYLEEALQLEKTTMMQLKAFEEEKTLLRKALETEKQKSKQLEQQVEKAINLKNKLEAKRKIEENATQKLLIQATSLRKERQQIEASAKSKEAIAKSKMQRSLQKYKNNIEKLTREIYQLQLETETSSRAASKKGTDESYTRTTYSKSLKIPLQARENIVKREVKQERECVMCLLEEKSVVFIPCAHQALCKTCNKVHEKQGMKDCPTCRTPIQRRICVCNARP